MAAEYINAKLTHCNPRVLIAYQWLDAQIKIKTYKAAYDLKSYVEEWAGYYISKSDVMMAASLHPDIYGEFPYYNISKRYTDPSIERLQGISEAFTHTSKQHNRNHYKYYEQNGIRLPIKREKI